MDDARTRALLAAGGLTVDDVDDLSARPVRYQPLQDPRAAHELGSVLADHARPRQPNRVLVGEDLVDAFLGFVVGTELGVPVTRVVESEGLLYVLGDLDAGDRVLVVADIFRRPDQLRPLLRVIENNGATTAAVTVLLGSPALHEVFPDAAFLIDVPCS